MSLDLIKIAEVGKMATSSFDVLLTCSRNGWPSVMSSWSTILRASRPQPFLSENLRKTQERRRAILSLVNTLALISSYTLQGRGLKEKLEEKDWDTLIDSDFSSGNKRRYLELLGGRNRLKTVYYVIPFLVGSCPK